MILNHQDQDSRCLNNQDLGCHCSQTLALQCVCEYTQTHGCIHIFIFIALPLFAYVYLRNWLHIDSSSSKLYKQHRVHYRVFLFHIFFSSTVRKLNPIIFNVFIGTIPLCVNGLSSLWPSLPFSPDMDAYLAQPYQISLDI